MGSKKFLILFMVLLFAAQGFAAQTATVNHPNGHTFFPITENQRFMDINVTVTDDATTNSIHTVTMQFDRGDLNVFIATDLNLDSSNCVFATSNDWSSPGADCVIRYTFPRTGTIIPTNTYVLDVNATGRDASGENTVVTQAFNTFRIDNRRVSTNVEAILLLSTLILAGILILVLAGFLGGVIDSNTMVLLAVLGIAAVIGIILVSEFLLLLTP